MRLRTRLSQELIIRLGTHVPLPAGGAWDLVSTRCILQQLAIHEATGIQGDWQQTAQYQGTLRAELLAEGVSQVATESLLASLLAEPLRIAPDDNLPVGEMSESARAMLTEYREILYQDQLIPALYFQLSGAMVRKLAAPSDIHEVHLGQAPDIGQAHQADYRQVV